MLCSAVITLVIIVVIFSQIIQALELTRQYYKTDSDILEDARLNTISMRDNTNVWLPSQPALIRKYGYPCEIHKVVTEDKYVLEMHRVPHGRGNNTSNTKPKGVVFLQHGLLSSSAEWVLMRPGKGLERCFFIHYSEPNVSAYSLADAGYDVWMGNARGNTYSRKHLTLKPSSSKFWKFSWHEIGLHDIPAMIDYILNKTGALKIQYIAFSQGTTVFWVLMSTKPEYNDKVSAMHALAPVGYLGNARSPLIKALAPFTNSLETISKILGTNEILPNGIINDLAGQTLCIEEAITQVLCTNLLFLICGFDEAQLNATMLPVVLGHTPAGASTKQFIHFGQLYKSNKFVQFDYGLIGNKRRYGTFKPPAYNLSKIRTPVFLHYADNDWLSSPKDVKRLFREIPSAVGIYRVPLPKFNHLDFVFAINATELIYNRVINIMSQFN